MPHPNRDRLEKAKEFFRRGDLPKAETALWELIEEDSPFADVYSLMGVIHYHEGRFGKAIEYLEKALTLNPHYAEALLYLSVICHDLGHYEKGKAHEKVLGKLPKRATLAPIAGPFSAKLANLHAEIADLYRGLGLYAEAKSDYERALALEPRYPDIRLKKILCDRALSMEGAHVAPSGRKESGRSLPLSRPVAADPIKELDQLLKDYPRYGEAIFELGVSHYLKGNMPAAKSAWQSLGKLDPKDKRPSVYLELLEKVKKPPTKEPILKKNPKPLPKAIDKGKARSKKPTKKSRR